MSKNTIMLTSFVFISKVISLQKCMGSVSELSLLPISFVTASMYILIK